MWCGVVWSACIFKAKTASEHVAVPHLPNILRLRRNPFRRSDLDGIWIKWHASALCILGAHLLAVFPHRWPADISSIQHRPWIYKPSRVANVYTHVCVSVSLHTDESLSLGSPSSIDAMGSWSHDVAQCTLGRTSVCGQERTRERWMGGWGDDG